MMGCDQMQSAWPLARNVKGLDLQLHFAIGLSDMLVLAQMLDPGFVHEAIGVACGIGRILNHFPEKRTSHWRMRRMICIAARNSDSLLRSMRYSMVTSTGPRSASTPSVII
jgi:hypothetical protein